MDKPGYTFSSQTGITAGHGASKREDDGDAVEVESATTELSSQAPIRKRRRVKRRRQTNFDKIPGIVKISLTPLTQKIVGCQVGEHVTGEKPWTYVKKEDIADNLELHEDSSEFLPFKNELNNFPRDDVLIIYLPSETSEIDEFYLCTTEDAYEKATDLINKQRKDQERRLYNTINRKIMEWASIGSEKEIDDEKDKTNRPLIEVELEASYPIMSDEVEFRHRKVEDARDGYVEVLSTRTTFQNIFKKRIDAGVQVAPPLKDNVAQTFCAYAKNVWTQYQYDCQIDSVLPEETEAKIKKYFKNNIEELCDWIRVNGIINLYRNDYQDLVVNEESTKLKIMTVSKEYMSFAETKVCMGKMISSPCWHPFWSGTVAIAYADVSPFAFITDMPEFDETEKAVHSEKPVLFWSFLDGLNPKLYLDSPREVTCLSFCPYDENILIGGCTNGQIIVWDIKNKLKHVEEEEILTNAQQNYRILMNSKMQWMKNVANKSRVNATAVSDLEFSHSTAVCSIQWINAFWEVTKTGQLKQIPDDDGRQSRQFVTAARDGMVLFWDLLAHPTLLPGSFRAHRPLKRLKKRPSALTVDVSPLRILNRVFRPIFQAFVLDKTAKVFNLTSLSMKFEPVVYEEVDPVPKGQFDLTERIIHRAVPNRELSFKMTSDFAAGTTHGDFIIASWEGFNYNSGEVVNSENCKILNIGRYHDGPIVSISRFVRQNILLSVGGSIIAVWREDFLNKPVLWRKCGQCLYTSGRWDLFRPTMLKITRSDGGVESWVLLSSTDTCLNVQPISGQALTDCVTHPLRMKRNVMGMADTNGSFRMFRIPRSMESDKIEEVDQLEYLLNKEVERKIAFVKWQTEWNGKYATWVQEKKDKAKLEQEIKKLEEETARAKAEEEAILEAKRREREGKPQPGQYSLWAKKQWNKREEDRMNRVLLAKKHLNKDMLVKQQLPLKRIAEEETRKKEKQEQRLKDAENIFNETVAMLFPEAVKAKPKPPADPYTSTYDEKTQNECYRFFDNMFEQNEQFVRNNTFISKFKWNNILHQGKNRRKNLDPAMMGIVHDHRHKQYKMQRNFNEENVRGRGRGDDVSGEGEEEEENQDVGTYDEEYGVVAKADEARGEEQGNEGNNEALEEKDGDRLSAHS